MQVHLMDTAGLHETEDLVENLGIQRSLQAAASAHLVIWLADASHPATAGVLEQHQVSSYSLNHSPRPSPSGCNCMSCQMYTIHPNLVRGLALYALSHAMSDFSIHQTCQICGSSMKVTDERQALRL